MPYLATMVTLGTIISRLWWMMLVGIAIESDLLNQVAVSTGFTVHVAAMLKTK